MTTVDDIVKNIQNKCDNGASIDGRVVFDFGTDGCIYVDGRVNPAKVSVSDSDADTRFICSFDTFKKIAKKELSAIQAYMTGKVRIKGSISLATQLNRLLEG